MTVPALVGRDGAKAADRAAQFGVGLGTGDLAAALALDGVDAVAIATPPHTHHQIVHQVLEAGKHVVCEKPFALNLTEAQEMLDSAERAGVIHLLGTEWRFANGQAQLARLVRAGEIGTPLLGVFELHVPTHADPTAPLPAWWELESHGGGWLGTHATHTIDQVRTTMGEIVGVSASLQRLAKRPSMTADDTYTVVMRLDNDATVLMHASCASRGPFVAVKKVVGSQATAWFDGDHVMTDHGAGPTKHPLPDDLPTFTAEPLPEGLELSAYDQWNALDSYLEPFARLYQVLRTGIEGGQVPADPVAPTFADGVASQAVLDAIRASSHNNGAYTTV